METGLYNYGARYYDPSLSLWLGVDPLADQMPGWSPYSYTFNNPINFIAPDGQFPIEIHVRSFAPFKSFGAYLWHGDNRGFSISLKKNVTSRMRQVTHYETSTGLGITDAYGSLSHTRYGAWAWSEAYVNDKFSSRSEHGIVNTRLTANNDAVIPYIDGFPPTFDIDVNTTLSMHVIEGDDGNQILSIMGVIKGDQFPFAESFVNDSEGNSIMLGTFASESGPNRGPFLTLGGNSNEQMIDINISIQVSKEGLFQGVLKKWNSHRYRNLESAIFK